MARENAGKLLPLAIRIEIRERRHEETVRQIAESLRLSKTTVQKYGYNRGTKPLSEKRESD